MMIMSTVDMLKAAQQGTEPVWCKYRWGAYWRHLANTIEPSMCGTDAAFCLITLAIGTEGIFGPLHAKFHPHQCNVSPLRGEKPQNQPLSNLNTGALCFAQCCRYQTRSAVPEMSDHLATIDLAENCGALPLWRGAGSLCNTMWPGPRSACVRLTKRHLDPSSRLAPTDMGRKVKAAVSPFCGGAGSLHLTQCRLGRSTVPKGILIHPTFGRNTPTLQRDRTDRQDNGPVA